VTLDNNLKPLVRIMKAWNHAHGHHLQSFHLEMMLYEMWHSEAAIKPWPEAVYSSLVWLPIWLKNPFTDPWAPGGQVDTYLSADARATALRLVEGDAKASGRGSETGEDREAPSCHR